MTARRSTLSFASTTVTLACLLAAGCAAPGGGGKSDGSSSGASAAAPAPAPAAAVAAAPAPAPAPAPRDELGYDQVKQTASGADARAELVGTKVAVTLTRAKAKGAPANAWVVNEADADGVFFRCRSSAKGFAGGDVTAKVVNYQVFTRSKQRVADLDHCEASATPVVATPAPAPAPAPAPVAAAAPAPAAAPVTSGGTAGAGKPGMDAQGRVVDSTKVTSGSGVKVKGLNNYEGEITGIPGAGSKFPQLQIGMPLKQVTDLIGQPSDQGAYVTGKAWIPFYFGGDRYRFELVYKNQGRLIFAGGSIGDFTSGHLIWVINNDHEPAYR